MATPTNPALINQLTEVVSVDPADWFLIEQGGVFKKLAGSDITGSSQAWTKSGNNAFYNTAFVGIGESVPDTPLYVNAGAFSAAIAIFLNAPAADGNTLVISDIGGGVGRKPGITFARNDGADQRWREFYDVDEDSINISYLGVADIRMKLLPDGGVVIPNMQTAPGITGTWWNDLGTVKIS